MSRIEEIVVTNIDNLNELSLLPKAACNHEQLREQEEALKSSELNQLINKVARISNLKRHLYGGSWSYSLLNAAWSNTLMGTEFSKN